MITKKWRARWLEMCDKAAAWSNCPRAKVAAFIIRDNQPIAQGFNGPPRGKDKRCGGDVCRRDLLKIESGTHTEIGCHHAEANAITQAARNGIPLKGAAMVINCEPCLSCSKLIHHAGIELIIIKSRGYSSDGLEYLKRQGIEFTLML